MRRGVAHLASKENRLVRSSLLKAAAVAALGAIVSCRGPASPSPGSTSLTAPNANSVGVLAVAFRTGTAVSRPHTPTGENGSELFVLGPDTLVVNSVDLVVRHLKLKTAATDSCRSGDEDDLVATTGGPQVADEDDDDGCGDVQTGSLIITLPLGGGPVRTIPITLPAGTYRKVQFKIHRLGTSAADSVLLAGRPDLAAASIRVAGTFNHTAFTYVTRTEIKQKQDLNPPVVVAPGASIDLTVRVDLSTWFLNRAGTALVNPATALTGQANAGLVARNIKNSFKAAHEDDDGDDDGGESDGGHHDHP
jgi:hypothetical protein